MLKLSIFALPYVFSKSVSFRFELNLNINAGFEVSDLCYRKHTLRPSCMYVCMYTIYIYVRFMYVCMYVLCSHKRTNVCMFFYESMNLSIYISQNTSVYTYMKYTYIESKFL